MFTEEMKERILDLIYDANTSRHWAIQSADPNAPIDAAIIAALYPEPPARSPQENALDAIVDPITGLQG